MVLLLDTLVGLMTVLGPTVSRGSALMAGDRANLQRGSLWGPYVPC